MHAPFGLGDALTLPEINIYYGQTPAEMWSFMADYTTFHYRDTPEWVFKTLWGEGLGWNNKPTWTEQADHWEKRLASGELSGIGYSLVTNRPVLSGTIRFAPLMAGGPATSSLSSMRTVSSGSFSTRGRAFRWPRAWWACWRARRMRR